MLHPYKLFTKLLFGTYYRVELERCTNRLHHFKTNLETLISFAPFPNLTSIGVKNIRAVNGDIDRMFATLFLIHSPALLDIEFDDEIAIELRSAIFPQLKSFKAICSEQMSLPVALLLENNRSAKSICVDTSKANTFNLQYNEAGGETIFWAFRNALPPFENLTSLDLFNCRNTFNDRTLQSLLPRLTQLRLFAFSHCADLGHLGLTGRNKKGRGNGIGLNTLASE